MPAQKSFTSEIPVGRVAERLRSLLPSLSTKQEVNEKRHSHPDSMAAETTALLKRHCENVRFEDPVHQELHEEFSPHDQINTYALERYDSDFKRAADKVLVPHYMMESTRNTRSPLTKTGSGKLASKWEKELQELHEEFFPHDEINIQALERCGGDVQRAIDEFLVPYYIERRGSLPTPRPASSRFSM